MKETPEKRAYIAGVLELYLSLPGTPTHHSRRDRQLAASLYGRRTPPEAIRTALLLATARRELRSPGAPRLPAVRTLFYFLPVIAEVLEMPPEDGYADYLEAKLRPLIARKAASLDQGVQIPSVLGAR